MPGAGLLAGCRAVYLGAPANFALELKLNTVVQCLL